MANFEKKKYNFCAVLFVKVCNLNKVEMTHLLSAFELRVKVHQSICLVAENIRAAWKAGSLKDMPLAEGESAWSSWPQKRIPEQPETWLFWEAGYLESIVCPG